MSMPASRRIALPLFAAAALALSGHPTSAAGAAIIKPGGVSAQERARLVENFGQVPLYFIENQGQMDNQVSHYLHGKDKSIYFTPAGVTFVLYPPTAMMDHERSSSDAPSIARQVVKLDFLNANANVQPRGHNNTGATVSYFTGSPDTQHSALPTYTGITYPNLWNGIDLAYDGARGSLKYTFTVQPHADPGQIRLAYRGAESVMLSAAGSLTVTTPAATLYDGSPIAWQTIHGQQINVPVAFTLDADAHTIGFTLGDYDTSQPLILDPAYLVYAGYLGGSDQDHGYAIAADASGNAYVTGYAFSTEATFPVVVGPDLSHIGGADIFVAKVNPAGKLVYAGYIGGSGEDLAFSIAVDAGGNAYMTGYTTSDQTTFPVTVGPDLSYNGGQDVFVAKVNAAGTALLYAGYIGGSSIDVSNGIAVDADGNAYVIGATSSDQATFPVTVGPDLSYNDGQDAFDAKVNAAGTALVYAGYIGGSGIDAGRGIAVDAGGHAYVTGYAESDQTTFPVAVGPDLTYNGGVDAFVAKVNAAGTALTYAGYIGGNSLEIGYGIALDSGGNAYVAGNTGSDQTTFPVIVGPDLTFNGNNEAFVAKVNAAGTALLYAGYIGGSSWDMAHAIAVDAGGNAYVTGNTTSDQATFPVTGGPGLSYSGGQDVFVAKVNSTGSALVYAGYIGGDQDEGGLGIAVDGVGNAYVTGRTHSYPTTFPAQGGPGLSYNGSSDAFVARITETPVTAETQATPVTAGQGERTRKKK